MGRLFGTDGVRGVLGSDLTPELVLRLSRAIGAFFGRGARVLVGRDSRSGGDMIARIVSAGLIAEGVKVFYAGLTPTPSLQLYIRDHGYDGGVMVTASHNPPEYNGVKVLGPDGIEVSRDDERVIEEHYFQGSFKGASWRDLSWEVVEVRDVNDYYVSRVAEGVDVEAISRRGFKVLVDCGNGAASATSPMIVRAVGARPVTLNCNPDWRFPGREPEPTPSSLAEASRTLRALKADLGVGHDADGDRAIFIDDAGEVHWGDRSGALIAGYAAERKLPGHPRRVYTGVSSSILVEEYLSRLGVKVEWTPVGSVVISHSLKRSPGVAGFEENGGYIHPAHQLVRDGGMTLALMLELLASEGATASELFARLPRYYAVKTKIPVGGRGEAECYVEAAKEMFSGMRLITIDGVKAVGEGHWVLVRPSGTEPVVRVMVEARDRGEAQRLAENIVSELTKRCRGRQG